MTRGARKSSGFDTQDIAGSVSTAVVIAAEVQDVLGTLRLHESELWKLGVSTAAVLGSVERGEAGAMGDVDVLVELDEDHPVGLFECTRLKLFVNSLLDDRADGVNHRALKPYLRGSIMRDAVQAF